MTSKKSREKGSMGPAMARVLRTAAGSSLGIGVCAYLSHRFFEPHNLSLLIGSFGASTVILYTAIDSQFSQPRSLIGGHIVSAFAGVAAFMVLGDRAWQAAALGVSLAILAMMLTRTVHPPGGATALIAATSGHYGSGTGFEFIVVPVGLGVLILFIVALAVYNISGERYPRSWL